MMAYEWQRQLQACNVAVSYAWMLLSCIFMLKVGSRFCAFAPLCASVQHSVIWCNSTY